MNVPVANPIIDERELELVIKTVKSGWISSAGENISKFEDKFAEFCNTKYAITTSNGTSALHLCLVAYSIGPGDEVIVPSMTFVATANAVVYTGAKPVFVDSEFDTWNIDPENIESKITPKTKAIIPVHLYGHPAKMDKIIKIAQKYNLIIIEDAAEAHGARYNNKIVGSIGNAGCFSFYGNKIITTGEGGMITTSNKAIADKIRTLRNHGSSPERKYYYPELGFNYRMTNIQAAIGLAQLEKITDNIERKKEIHATYCEYLQPLHNKITMQPNAEWAESVFWMFSILLASNGKISRDSLIDILHKKGIESRPFFFPLHKYIRFNNKDKLPVSEYLGNCGISLPSGPKLSRKEIRYVCDEIISILD
ncbi:MAG: hypothetical protein ACD_37C00596G0009 [uncultured bacterium]|nr:MAG: hypothetical protein ACD_37C00596G0009 [uncultured bacterium]